VNYIREINAFYDWLELNELSKPAVLLWHALMHLNNKSGWQESFTVARSVIEAKTSLKKDAYYKARNQLKQYGLLEFKERGTKATVFRMNPVSSVLQTTYQTNYHDLSVKQTTSQTETQTTNETTSQTTNETINKLNEIKLNETNTKKEAAAVQENPFTFYEQNGFGVIGGHISQKIAMWCDDLSDELVLEAMKISVERSKVNWAYVETILRDYAQKNIRTVDQAQASLLAFKERQSKQKVKPRQGYTPARKEALPDWFNQQRNQYQPQEEEVDLDFEREKAELMKELQQFKSEKREA
jgi:DnaD/phage-associated family protein